MTEERLPLAELERDRRSVREWFAASRLTVSVAAIIAVAVNTDGRREIVGLHIGPSEAETFWSTFLKSLVRRGLHGLERRRRSRLVISDAHEGVKAAIRRVMGFSRPAPDQDSLDG